MLKIGIIGAGRMGNSHAGNLAKLDNVKLSAVYDINPEKSKAFAEKYPTAAIMNSPEELVGSSEVEFIIITSPTYCHKEGLLPAMATGKPIFCEKPLCRTPEDLKELAPMIRDYKNLFAIGFVRRYAPSVVMMKKLIDEGKIGKLICGSICCLFGGFRREWGDWFADFDKSGGVTLDMITHHCDLQNYMVGKPLSVYAQAMRLPKVAEKPRDYVSATAVFEGGYISNMQCSWLRGGPSASSMDIYGEKGSLRLSDSNGLSFFDIGGAETKILPDPEILAAMPPIDVDKEGMLAMEDAVLVDCVINHKKPYANAEAAIKAMEFCLAMLKSAETGEIMKF